MERNSVRFRLMSQQYEVQLLTARHMARNRQKQLALSKKPPPDPQEQRRKIVKRIAHEFYSVLISIDSGNPIIEDILQELSDALGSKVVVTYLTPEPFSDAQLRLLRQLTQEDFEFLSDTEHKEALYLLWKIVQETVDRTTI